MPPSEVHIGDQGTLFVVTLFKEDGTILNVSAATTLQMIFKPPTATHIIKTASMVTDGTDGKIQVVMGNDFAEAGNWTLQAHVIDGGNENYSSFSHFTVKENV